MAIPNIGSALEGLYKKFIDDMWVSSEFKEAIPFGEPLAYKGEVKEVEGAVLSESDLNEEANFKLWNLVDRQDFDGFLETYLGYIPQGHVLEERYRLLSKILSHIPGDRGDPEIEVARVGLIDVIKMKLLDLSEHQVGELMSVYSAIKPRSELVDKENEKSMSASVLDRFMAFTKKEAPRPQGKLGKVLTLLNKCEACQSNKELKAVLKTLEDLYQEPISVQEQEKAQPKSGGPAAVELQALVVGQGHSLN